MHETKFVDLTARGYVNEGRYRLRAGWASKLRCGKHSRILSGSERSKSERRLELLGIVSGLKALKYSCDVTIHTATEYISDGAYAMLGGKGTFAERVHAGTAKNGDLWAEFEELTQPHSISIAWEYRRGDNDDDGTARFAARMAAYSGNYSRDANIRNLQDAA